MQIEARRIDKSPKASVKFLTFQEWINVYQKRFGKYPYGYDPKRPMDFMCMGVDPRLLEYVWKAAQENKPC